MIANSRQHLVEFSDCDIAYLEDASKLEKLILAGITHAELSHIQIIKHQFAPRGVTIVAIICESHIAIHTFPESKHASLDIFTCSDSNKHYSFINYIKQKLVAGAVEHIEIQRGKQLKLIDAAQ